MQARMSLSDLKLVVQAVHSTLDKKTWQPYERSRMDQDINHVMTNWMKHLNKVEELDNDQRLTGFGKTERRVELSREMRRVLEPVDRRLTELNAELEAGRKRAKDFVKNAKGEWVEKPNRPRSVENLLVENEIRQHLRTLDPIVRNRVYLSAVMDGDEDTVAAVERAPGIIRVVDAETREKADEWRVNEGPVAGSLSRIETQIHAYSFMLNAAKHDLAAEEANWAASGQAPAPGTV